MIDKITPQIAALYLGQKCESTNGASFCIASVSLWGVTDGDRFHAPFEGLTLHLRRLESMTEDEARELYQVAKGLPYDREDLGEDAIDYLNDYYTTFYGLECFTGNPQAFLHLLSKGFDLFGLIDAGLAKEIEIKDNGAK